MKISDLAERSGISTHTLHYYEKIGLWLGWSMQLSTW
jgi:DNA-binding transcriptional MerR regulator